MSASIEQRNQDATCYTGNLDSSVTESLLWEVRDLLVESYKLKERALNSVLCALVSIAIIVHVFRRCAIQDSRWHTYFSRCIRGRVLLGMNKLFAASPISLESKRIGASAVRRSEVHTRHGR